MPERNVAMVNANKLKLGLFAANCSSGTAVTKVAERWDASWESNLALAMMADAAGIEFMLPIARWKGYGGETDFQGETLETITWAGGLLAHTRNMTVFGTVHAPLLHPVIAAKQMATVDHISGGRFGVNIVCGWNQDEFEMFGVEQREHDVRYDYGQEWWDVIRRLWTEPETFDFDGRFIRLRNLAARPKPWGSRLPILMNAGSSPPGQRFAARNCDMMFTALIDFGRARAQLASIHALAAEYGRKVKVYTSSHVVCRATEREARDYHRHYAIDNADEEAVERLMRLQGLYAQSYPTELIDKFRIRFAGGHGSYPIVGTPDQVAEEFKRIHDAGFAGATIAMVNYLDSLPYLVQEVLPRLERMGLRGATV